MRIKDIIAVLEEYAPLALQAGYDNSGLLVGRAEAEVSSALVCVDVTEEVMDEAVAAGAGLVISHHPLIFTPLKHLTGGSRAEQLVERAIKNNIAIYACHTNLDATGMSRRLAQWLGLTGLEVLEKETGFGVVGTLETPEPAEDFLRRVTERLSLKALRYSKLTSHTVQRVALCTGAGEELLQKAVEAQADIFLTADIRHHNFVDAPALGITVADIGHYESEKCAVELLIELINKIFPTFAVRPSATEHNPVTYLT